MCGIFGILKTRESLLTEDDLKRAQFAAKCMQKRGPDDEGYWSDTHVAFSFRRLSILDLSKAGHQPMLSGCGNYALVFNGELYNYQEIKKDLLDKGYQFRSHTDSEVVLHALSEWGERALNRFNGMYALGFWNGIEKSLLVSRDHVGMKPLYYSFYKGTFIFGSQLDQILLAIPKKDLTLDTLGLGLFISVGYYPSPRTVFKEIQQLEPGKWIKVKQSGELVQGEHFNLYSFYLENRNNVPDHTQLRDTLEASVKRHLMSDVPIGTFLSGGLDSSIVTAFVQKHMGNDFTAYTLSNKGTIYDEAGRASLAADFLKIPHKIVYPDRLLKTIQSFQQAYQEPFGDYSALPSLLVTEEARKKVKVMLSGDGSDEFFFGYTRMTPMLQAARYYRLPLLFRRALKKLDPSISAITFNNLHHMILKKQSFLHNGVLQTLGLNENELAEEFIKPFNAVQGLNRDMLIKLNTIHRYFQLQLMKLDRASMFNSVEARVPFADKELLKYTIAYTAADVSSDNYRILKMPLRKIHSELYPQMPPDTGPKKGFTVDMQSFLDHELKDYYIDMLESNTIFTGYLDMKGMKTEFLKGNIRNTFFNWFLLSLQSWSKIYYHNN